MSLKMQGHLNLKNLCVRIAAKFLYKTAQNMARILFSLNVNFAVQQLNGFVGEILIFVSLVIKNNVTEIMSVNIRKKNCQNVMDLRNAPSEETIMEMDNKKLLGVRFAEIIKLITKISDLR